MIVALAVGVAGAAGAVARWLTDGAVQDRMSGSFPCGTLTVNLVGSFVLGIVAGLLLHHPGATTTNAVVGAGFCGGLTTWSTVSWETVRLVEEGAVSTALGFTMLNLLGSLVAGALGIGAGLLAG